MDKTKEVLICSFAALAAYFQPLQDIILGVSWVFVVNFICGLLTGKIVNKESFVFRKAFVCFAEALVIFGLMTTVFIVGEKIDNAPGAMQCITGIVYALLYFYGVNITRNLCLLFPNNKLLCFIYYVISIEFAAKIPYIKDFLKDFLNRKIKHEDNN